MLRIQTVLAAAVLTAPPAIADTLTVGPAGSGADYDEIGDAVLAAAPGDVVLVFAGEYNDYGTIVVDKPLTILGAGSAVTRFNALPQSVVDLPLPLLVTQIDAGEEVRIAGIELRSHGFGPSVFGPTIAVVADCAGPVVLADVAGFGTGGAGVVRVQGSAQVLLDGCSLKAGVPGPGQHEQPGLAVVDSVVHVNACVIAGSTGLTDWVLGSGAGDGAPGIDASGSTVRLSRSVVTGGPGGMSSMLFAPPISVGNGAPAIAASGGFLFLRGGAGNELQGGAGPAGEVGGVPIYGAGAPALVAQADVFLSTTPDVVALAGSDGDGSVTAPPVVALGGWTQLLERMATLAAVPTVASPGAVVALQRGAEPGALFLASFAFSQAPALAIPGVAGVVVLPIGGYASLPAGAIGPGGEAELLVAVPGVPALAGVTLVVQGLAASPLGALSLSAPALVAIAQ